MTLEASAYESAALIPFLLVQLSSVVFLLRYGKKDKTYRQAFFVFFVSVTIADCINVLTMRIVSALFQYQLVVATRDGIYDTSLTDALELSITVLEYVEHACSNFQPLCHAVIAVNRLTAFAWPLKHAHIWRRKTVVIVIVVVLAASVFLEGAPNVYYFVEESTVASSDFAIMELALRVANVVLCFIVAFILNMATVAMFIVYRKSGKMQIAQKSQDVRLFAHSLFMFLVQACLALQRVVEMTDYYSFVLSYTETTGFGLWLPDWLKVDSTRWLAGDEGCFNGDDLKNADKGQRPCGLLYLTLGGYLWLAGVVSSGELTTYLYLLSGGPSLLLVSGNVCNAFVKFYFTRRRETSVIKLQTVTLKQTARTTTRLTQTSSA